MCLVLLFLFLQAACGKEPVEELPVEEPPVLQETDDMFYVTCMQNSNQGNNVVYADGFFYFRSQTLDYSLCRSEGAGLPSEVVADQIPGEMIVLGDQIYFISVSDGQTLYKVGTDGGGLAKLSEIPMQDMAILGDTVYFLSVYEDEDDIFYQISGAEAAGDRYIYSMKTDGSGCRLLVAKVCAEFTMDENGLYYENQADGKWILYRCGPDGTGEEKLTESDKRISCLLAYQGGLYYIADGALARLDIQKGQAQDTRNIQRGQAVPEPEILAQGVQGFTISGGKIYLFRERGIWLLDPEIREEELLAEISAEEDGFYPFAASRNRGIFLAGGKLFVKYFASADKGVLWHVWDAQKKQFVVFEDTEPLCEQDLVLDASVIAASEVMNYCPGRQDEEAGRYLAGELIFQSSYEDRGGTKEVGDSVEVAAAYSDFRIMLPQFGEQLQAGETLNRQMEELFQMAMEDGERFYRKIEETEEQFGSGTCSNWDLQYGYDHLYIGEKYISMYCYRDGYSGGIRSWEEAIPLTFVRDTGRRTYMDDLFTVERSRYMKRLTAAVYKMCEMRQIELDGAWDANVLYKNFRPEHFYLTPDGLVLCYDIYTILPGVEGNPTFEIPYERFADLFR